MTPSDVISNKKISSCRAGLGLSNQYNLGRCALKERKSIGGAPSALTFSYSTVGYENIVCPRVNHTPNPLNVVVVVIIIIIIIIIILLFI